MSIQARLCTFRTADRERLHGLLFAQANAQSDLASILVHGVTMNFYLPPLVNFVQELAEGGFHSFVINTRGHDWIARAGNLTKFGGAAYVNLADCLLDFDGALDFLKHLGYRRFILIGHSLGAIKSILYQGTRQRSDVVGVVSGSAPKQFYAERIARRPKFAELIAAEESMVAQGRGENLLSVSVGSEPVAFQRAHAPEQVRQRRPQRLPALRRSARPSAACARRRRRAQILSWVCSRAGRGRRQRFRVQARRRREPFL